MGGPGRVWGARKGWGGPKFRAFFPLPPPISFFLPSLGGLLVELWPRFKDEVPTNGARVAAWDSLCERAGLAQREILVHLNARCIPNACACLHAHSAD